MSDEPIYTEKAGAEPLLLVSQLARQPDTWDELENELGLIRLALRTIVQDGILGASELREAVAPDESPVLLLIRLIPDAKAGDARLVFELIKKTKRLSHLHTRVYLGLKGRDPSNPFPPWFEEPANLDAAVKLAVDGGGDRLLRQDPNLMALTVRHDKRENGVVKAVFVQMFPEVRGLSAEYFSVEHPAELPKELAGFKVELVTL